MLGIEDLVKLLREVGGTRATGRARFTLEASGGVRRSGGTKSWNSIIASSQTLGPNQVNSLRAELAALEVFLAESPNGEDVGWVPVAVKTGELALTGLGEEPTLIAQGQLPAGDFRGVRLHLANATITLRDDAVLGPETDPTRLAAGEPHALTIASAAGVGVRIPEARFTVGEAAVATIRLQFDLAASLEYLAVAGAGLVMAPVLGLSDRAGAPS